MGDANHSPESPAAFYAGLLPKLREVAISCGYALGVHGTTQRDFDVVAAPWVEDASSAEELAQAIMIAVGGFTISEHHPDYPHAPYPNAKPHGRRAWAIFLSGGLYVDLSVMPRATS